MKDVEKYIKQELDLAYGESVIVAVSGGPDSMGLLNILVELRNFLNLEIICAHVHHNVRNESDDEKVFVEKYCKKNKVTFEWTKINSYGDDNFHNEARSIRYKYFKKMIRKYNARYLFTAHHGDDLIETILMRLVRGSTLRGYGGFSKKITIDGYTIVRPLISVTKKEIEKYCREKKVPFMVDASNEKDVYTRNRFRKYIVSNLKKEDVNVHKKFLKFSEVLQESNEYIDKIVNQKLKNIYPQDVLNIEAFKQEASLIQHKIIYHMLEKMYQDDLMLITDQHVNLLQDLIVSEKPNALIHLPNKINAVKSYQTLTLIKQEVIVNDFHLEITDYVNLANGKNIEKIAQTNQDDNSICRLNSADLTMPLYARSKKEGDKMTVKGMLGSKKIADIFIENKIDFNDRKKWPIVIDATGLIVWLPGLKKSKLNKEKNEKYDIILKYY